MAVVRSEAELQQALAIVDAQRKDELTRADATQRFIEDVQSSLLYSLNWSELLSAAPMAISLMGACYAASTVPDATSVMLTEPTRGFEILKWKSLNANLVQCSDMGRDAFIKAEANMGSVSQLSKNMFESVGDIITALGDREAATDLKFITQSMKRNAVRCQTAINEIESSFDLWLACVSELHQACVQEENITENMIRDNEAQLKAKQARLEGAKVAEGTAKTAVDRMSQVLDTTEEAFKKAADNFPSGWELIGMQFVSSFADTLTSAVGQGMLASMGDTGVGISALNIFSKPTSEGKDITAKSQPGPPSTLTIPNADDPAYGFVSQAVDATRTLMNTLTGYKGGVDWEDIMKSEKSGLSLTVGIFEFIKGAFRPSNEAPSLKLQSILNTSDTILDGLTKLSKELVDLTKPRPDASSPEVVEWQKQALNAYTAAVELKSQQTAMPGVPAGGTPLVNPGDSVQGQGKSGSVASNYLAAAEERYNMAQKSYEGAQERYLKASDSLKDTQLQIAAIMGDLAMLDAKKISMETIKRILVKCMHTLASLKTEVSNLARFFLAVGKLIDYVTDTQVLEFIKYLETLGTAGDGPSIAGFTFTDFRRQTIFTFAVMIRCYFTIFRGVGMMYTTVSQQYIFPGLKLLDELSSEASSDNAQGALNQKLTSLNKFTKGAEQGVKQVVQDKQGEIMGNMEKSAAEIAKKTEMLPAPPAQKKAIEAGAKTITDVVTSNIDNTKTLIGRPFSSTASLLPPDND